MWILPNFHKILLFNVKYAFNLDVKTMFIALPIFRMISIRLYHPTQKQVIANVPCQGGINFAKLWVPSIDRALTT